MLVQFVSRAFISRGLGVIISWQQRNGDVPAKQQYQTTTTTKNYEEINVRAGWDVGSCNCVYDKKNKKMMIMVERKQTI